MSTIFAVDFETYYNADKKDPCSVKNLGNWAYTHHPLFKAYLLSVVSSDGYEWVGAPENFDWEKIRGRVLIAHNCSFELAVIERLREDGIVPKDWTWGEFHDTADLTAYLGYPRSLGAAVFYLQNKTLDKGMRDRAKGKNWEDMEPDFQEAMKQYCLEDSREELTLWQSYNHLWPDWEKELSAETREMAWRGLPVDLDKAKQAVKSLKNLLWKARQLIPWAEDPDAKILSLPRAKEECLKHHIDPPVSMAKDSPEFEEWLEKYGEKFPWAKAMGDYRSINMLLKKIETLIERTNPQTGWMTYGLKYFGAHTGRDSGDAGFNVQNPPRHPMFGVDLRSLMIKAPPGYILGVADSGQIEPRILNTLAGDKELLALMAQGMDIYEASARATDGYSDSRPLKDVDPKLRQYNKVKVLGLGYGAGPDKTILIAKKQVGLELSLVEAKKIVTDFRKRKFIPELWNKLEEDMRKSAPGTYELELPSGRILRYREVRSFGACSAVVPKLGKMLRLKWWGGPILENLIQGTCRDIFLWQVMQLKKSGIQILLRCHDEVVMLFKIAEAEKQMNNALKIMSTAPPWLPSAPLTADGILTNFYCKP